MAETTYTRQTLRRAIATELQMPFFRKYKNGYSLVDAGSTTTKIVDAALTQREGFWSGHWFYGLTWGDVSLIRAFTAADHSFQLEVPMTGTPSADADRYEIHTIWNALDIHNALNRALAMASRSFPETIVDETMVFTEDKMEYDLTGLAKKPFIILRAFAEKPSILIKGTVVTAFGDTVTIDQAAIGDIEEGWMISFYSGTGANQVYEVTDTSSFPLLGVSDFMTVTPAAGDKYAMWNPNRQRYDWNRMDIFYTDAIEFPNKLRIRTRMPYYYGMRIRLEYLYANESLDTEGATTIVPKEYLINAACAILHGQKLNDTKVDRDLHFAEFTRYDKLAKEYLASNAPRMPATTIPVSDSPLYMDNENPLGWPGSGGDYY